MAVDRNLMNLARAVVLALVGTTACVSSSPASFRVGEAQCKLVRIQDSSQLWLCCEVANEDALWCKPEIQMRKPKLHNPDSAEATDL